MAENSKIEWTDHTFNPWIGCTKVSDGCKHCYAETLMDHRYKKVEWGPEGTRVRTSAANWKKPVQWNKQAAAEGRRYKVFCASLADVFEDRPDLEQWRRDLFNLILATPNLDWLLLTKRPQNIKPMLQAMPVLKRDNVWDHLWPEHFPNVWIGTSVEDQKAADERIPELLQIPAKVRFLSMEPLLGPVNLYPASTMGRNYVLEMEGRGNDKGLHWVIVGGESGPNARPMHPVWARSIRDRCQVAGVPFFFKQWGEWSLKGAIRETASTVTDFGVLSFDGEWFGGSTGWNGRPIDPDTGEAYMQKVGKRAAGRLLDGRTWDEFPVVTP